MFGSQAGGATAARSQSRGIAIVWGLLGAQPFGGMVWQVVHHLVALRRLGFDVWYVEEATGQGFDPISQEIGATYSRTAPFLHKWLSHFGFGDRWVLTEPNWMSGACYGARDAEGLVALYGNCVLALNLCGAHWLTERHMSIGCRIYLETDPVRVQVGLAKGDARLRDQIALHDACFTYGTNIGECDCAVPDSGIYWHPTRPPVCLELWHGRPSAEKVTTVANLSHSKNHTEWNGEKWHWSKATEFKKFENLPSKSSLPLEIALGANSKSNEVARLRGLGWSIVPAHDYDDPFAYRDYIQGSMAEFSVAKEQYVKPRSGWFSDRSVCYLAAGRPVVVQGTGFDKTVPTGEGLFAVDNCAEAADALDAIAKAPERQALRAREIAGDCFDADKVLGAMVEEVGL